MRRAACLRRRVDGVAAERGRHRFGGAVARDRDQVDLVLIGDLLDQHFLVGAAAEIVARPFFFAYSVSSWRVLVKNGLSFERDEGRSRVCMPEPICSKSSQV